MSDAVYRGDVRVHDGRSGARLASKPPAAFVVERVQRSEHLERHAARELEILGLVDDAHRAAPEPPHDPIRSEDGARHRETVRGDGALDRRDRAQRQGVREHVVREPLAMTGDALQVSVASELDHEHATCRARLDVLIGPRPGIAG